MGVCVVGGWGEEVAAGDSDFGFTVSTCFVFLIRVSIFKGTPFWVLLNIGVIQDELKENVLFLITIQDISEFKEPINPNCEFYLIIDL